MLPSSRRVSQEIDMVNRTHMRWPYSWNTDVSKKLCAIHAVDLADFASIF
ncbi:hypothetical protein Plhal304r1_c036g0111571 [Plasmopara halstedii]